MQFVWHNLPFILLFLLAHTPEHLEEILTQFLPHRKGHSLPHLTQFNLSRKERQLEYRHCALCHNSGLVQSGFVCVYIQYLPLRPNPRCFKGSLNSCPSTMAHCGSPLTFLHKGQCPHTKQRREQEAGLMLRSLYGSTHPQGDTVHCPERLKLATSLQDGCLNAASISSPAYIFILNLAELSLSPYVCVSPHSSQSGDMMGKNNRYRTRQMGREWGRQNTKIARRETWR